MKIEVGCNYNAATKGNICEYWTFQIIAEIKQDGNIYYMGLKQKISLKEWPYQIVLFDKNGKEVISDDSNYHCGFLLVSKSNSKKTYL